MYPPCYHFFMDINTLAHKMVKKTTEEKNPAAVSLGRLGGVVGGHARARKLSAQRKKEIAQKAAQARWKK